MTYITVYNLSINSNYRILAAELNYRFTFIYLFIILFIIYLLPIYFNQLVIDLI